MTDTSWQSDNRPSFAQRGRYQRKTSTNRGSAPKGVKQVGRGWPNDGHLLTVISLVQISEVLHQTVPFPRAMEQVVRTRPMGFVSRSKQVQDTFLHRPLLLLRIQQFRHCHQWIGALW